jgi:lysophospholipase L1-like esterase
VETSSDSSDGADGTWRTVVDVHQVTTHSGSHSFGFAGQRWVKFVVTAAPTLSPNGVQIDELEVRAASEGVSDAWFFMGDSITAFAFGRTPRGEVGFASIVHRLHPGYAPQVVNGGVGGDKVEEGVKHIAAWLQLNRDARFWCIGYGTNDAAGNASDTTAFRTNLLQLIERVELAGRVVILATIPFASDGQHRNIPVFNRVIEELQRGRGLLRGPDLYAWFAAHPDELRDGVHPNERGIGSINRLWAKAVDGLYAGGRRGAE